MNNKNKKEKHGFKSKNIMMKAIEKTVSRTIVISNIFCNR
jgi:preprotein translocase subunit SecF